MILIVLPWREARTGTERLIEKLGSMLSVEREGVIILAPKHELHASDQPHALSLGSSTPSLTHTSARPVSPSYTSLPRTSHVHARLSRMSRRRNLKRDATQDAAFIITAALVYTATHASQLCMVTADAAEMETVPHPRACVWLRLFCCQVWGHQRTY